MTIRSTIALFYVMAAAAVAVISGPGPSALAGEIAVLAVFETAEDGATQPVTTTTPTRIHWELDDLPAYLTEETADQELDLQAGATEVAETRAVQ